MTKLKFLLAGSAGFALLAGAAPAFAQAADEQADSAGSGNEIVVTAQKRAEALQDVPIAISAFKADALADQGIKGVMELAKVTPSLLITEGSGQGQPFIRGVGGRNITPGNEATAAIYVDGVYQTDKTGMMLQGFPDVDSVQVLRGPQGTLFGRNATSGAILLTTKKPRQEFGAMFEGTLGTDEVGGRGFITGPIAPTLSFAVSGFYRDQYPYLKNLNRAPNILGTQNGLGDKVGGERGYGARGSILWEPSSTFSATLAGYWTKGYTNAIMAVQPVRGGPGTLGGFLADSVLGLDISSPDRAYYGEIEPEVRFEGYGGSLTLDADLGAFSVKSISAYHHDGAGVQLDLDGSPVPVFWFDTDLEGRAWQQEVDITSNGSGPFQWILGAFYIDYKDGYKQLDQYVGLPVPSTLQPHVVPAALATTPGAAYIDQHSFVTIRSLGLFGEVSYEFTPATKLTLGARYTSEKSILDGNNGTTTYVPDGAGGVLSFVSTTAGACAADPVCQDRGLSTKFTRATWRAVLDHKFSDDFMGYLSYNRGFKSGVYNISTITNIEATKPEIIDAFEAGIKTSAMNGMLTFNASAYYYKYKNLQVAIVSPITNTQSSINAAEATISGLEIESTVRPTDNLTLSAGFSTFFQAKYDKFPACLIYRETPAGNVQIPGADADCSGTRLPVTPDVMFNLSASYKIPLANGGDIELGGLYSHISSFDHASYGFYAAGGTGAGAYPAGIGRAPRQAPQNTVNLYATFHAPDDKFYVTVWGKDLTNPDNVYRNLFTTSFGYYTSLTRGITGGITIGTKFGSERR